MLIDQWTFLPAATRACVTWLVVLVFSLGSQTWFDRAQYPSARGTGAPVIATETEATGGGVLHTGNGPSQNPLAVLDVRVRPEQPCSFQAHVPAEAGTRYLVISPLLFTETASSFL